MSDKLDKNKEYTIGEISSILDVKEHTIRFWEQKFPTLSPIKMNNGRRKYVYKDLILLQHIKYLLYEEGYTLKGAQKEIKQEQNIYIHPANSVGEELFNSSTKNDEKGRLAIAQNNKEAERRNLENKQEMIGKINDKIYMEVYTRINDLIDMWEKWGTTRS